MTPEQDRLARVYCRTDRFQYQTDAEGIVTLIEPQDHPVQQVFRRIGVQIPEQRRLTLDHLGSHVFLSIDGQTPLRSIAQDLERKFGSKAQPTCERLLIFVEYLERRLRVIRPRP